MNFAITQHPSQAPEPSDERSRVNYKICLLEGYDESLYLDVMVPNKPFIKLSTSL